MTMAACLCVAHISPVAPLDTCLPTVRPQDTNRNSNGHSRSDRFGRFSVKQLRFCYEHDVRLSVCLSVCNVGGL